MNKTPARTTPPNALETLAKNSRSFWLASIFLPPNTRLKAAQLYRFCRTLDDAVDEAPSVIHAHHRVHQYRTELEGRHSLTPSVVDFLELHQHDSVPMWAALGLLEGMESDLDVVRMQDDGDLLLYCYRAAGTVGVMMCGVLGVTHPRAIAPAIDLGIAMQLTNICRDVLEDAGRNRIYLPAQRLASWGVAPEALVQGSASPEAVSKVVSELLHMADQFYDKGRSGLHYIPWQARFPIHVAAAVYQQIGHRLRRRHQNNALHGRTVVPLGEKIWAIAKHSIRAFGIATSRALYQWAIHRSRSRSWARAIPAPTVNAEAS